LTNVPLGFVLPVQRFQISELLVALFLQLFRLIVVLLQSLGIVAVSVVLLTGSVGSGSLHVPPLLGGWVDRS